MLGLRLVTQPQSHIVVHRSPRKDAVLLEHEHAARIRPAHRLAIDLDDTAVGSFKAAEDVQQRGLATARRPEQAHELARAHIQVNGHQGLQRLTTAVIGLAYTAHMNLHLRNPQRTSSKRSRRRTAQSKPMPITPMMIIAATTRS